MKYKKDSGLLWRWMTNFWSIVSFLVIAENFRTSGGLTHLLGPVLAVYIAMLAIFSAEKEFERWHFYNKSRHLGEIYVVAWTAFIFGMIAFTYLTGSDYQMESEIFSTYIVVLGILAITRKSKQAFTLKNE